MCLSNTAALSEMNHLQVLKNHTGGPGVTVGHPALPVFVVFLPVPLLGATGKHQSSGRTENQEKDIPVLK
jgi:hypothetical protein